MTRCWIFAVLACVALAAGLSEGGGAKKKDKDFKVEGKFAKDDFKDAERNGPSHTHVVPMEAGKVYTIDMVSGNVDSYLRLLDSKDKQLAEDDDSGGNLNARIIFNCTKDGDYKVVCTTVGPADAGSYVMTVKTGGAVPTSSSSHTNMTGKAAPGFTADFAINGKPGKLSDLAGKIVVLDFCDVRNPQSMALQPRLDELHKTYKEKGLIVVSVAFYPSDIGQSLAFDKEAGAVKTVKKSDRNSDRALFKECVAHHKIQHTLFALPKQAALDTFNDYYVNGVPQLVLIDRKGIVRRIDVGGELNTGPLEKEIQKLIAEK